MTATPPLPEAFVRRMALQLGDSARAYFAAMAQPPVRGLRLNPLKPPDAPLDSLVDGLGEAIAWEPNGRFLSLASKAGAHPLHEAGAYYIQEPSAMLPAALLAARPGETVLDLCAAPGGKSTQLAASMAGEGTLVCNEPVPGRAQVLSRNLERMGVTNAVVVSAEPNALALAWPELFDAVLVDAPCSGEGMFRRHPETRLEWNEHAPARCAARQRNILESACAMLKVGGRLCYSTCTLNPEENELTFGALLQAHPEMQPIPFQAMLDDAQPRLSQDGHLQLYPHEITGEGHFVAMALKTGHLMANCPQPCLLMPARQALSAPVKACADMFLSFWQELSQASAPQPSAMLGETLLQSPPLPPLRGIRVLRAGLALGQYKGKVFAPDHALAMAAPPYAIRRIPLNGETAAAYLHGDALPAPEPSRGYYTVACHGLPLGFVKASDGWLKNHYPKGLRRP